MIGWPTRVEVLVTGIATFRRNVVAAPWATGPPVGVLDDTPVSMVPPPASARPSTVTMAQLTHDPGAGAASRLAPRCCTG